MSMNNDLENFILNKNPDLLDILLLDRTTKKNIIWATDNYKKKGLGYFETDEIKKELITGKHSNLIKPRIEKSKIEQNKRIKDKAEVFTPSWVCNKQNNLVDKDWFGFDAFNEEEEHSWKIKEKVLFPKDKTWKDYISLTRMEITCGEAPYLVSRYDTVTGEQILLFERIGFFDRKMRVIEENATNNEWLEYSFVALKNIYGFEFQGDSLLLARKNMFFSFIEYFQNRFNQIPNKEILKEAATIISWNIFQMDGLKFVAPLSCHEEEFVQMSLFGDEPSREFCKGCTQNSIRLHNGKYCYIMDWEKNKKIRFLDLVRGAW